MIVNITHASEIFTDFLKKGSYRITPERFEVLEYAFKQTQHFSADELFLTMKSEGSNISRATVYNTLELLVACGLLSKHNFMGKEARYEKSLGVIEHDHLICLNCGKISEFDNNEILKIQEKICEEYGFIPVNHTFNIYGYCKDPESCKKNRENGNENNTR
jgi:Fur family ferric uptake transcriptional regulator